MTTPKDITIKPAKGRPMLTWVGKRPLRRVTAFPAQLVERFSAESTKPARARLTVKRAKGKLKVAIQDFISPSILERLKQQAGILSPQIDDWRAMVDSVMIDSAYDGHVFNIALADVPERKSDLVSGEYELAAPTGPTTVAVKITDMLGEEVLEERHV